MTHAMALALLLAAAPADTAEPLEPGRLEHLVDGIVAMPEFQHLGRYRDSEDEEQARSSSSTRPGRTDSERKRPQASGTPAAPGSGMRLPDLGPLVAMLRLLVYAALAAVVVWIVVLVARLVQQRGDAALAPAVLTAQSAAEAATPEVAPDECLRQALALARAGRFGDGIRLLLLGGLGVVERRGLIRPRKGLTNRDYVRAARREPALRQALEGLVRTFDEIHFGRRAATAERFEHCLASYRAATTGQPS